MKAVLNELKIRGFFKEYKNIYDFRITNATTTIEYKKITNRSEATITEIKNKGNLSRLLLEIKPIDETIICFGKKAQTAINAIRHELKDDLKIIKTRHLSPRAFNTIKGLQNFQERVNYYCDDIINQISK